MDARSYPSRPVLAVSAAIVHEGRVLVVRRARKPAFGLYPLPGGAVEVGDALREAIVREAREETALEIAPGALAGYREAIGKDAAGRIERHFVILSFAARWLAPPELAGLKTTEGLEDIVQAAVACLAG